MRKKSEEKNVSSITVMDEIEAERKRTGKKPLCKGNACSGASGSWKNLKKK